MRNQAQLIVYVDRLPGGTFRDLLALLDGPFAGLFGGVHVLPFFHRIDGADAGFDPIDHTQVDARLGTWDDVRALAHPVLRHRVLTNFHAQSEGVNSDALIDRLLEFVPVPRSGM